MFFCYVFFVVYPSSYAEFRMANSNDTFDEYIRYQRIPFLASICFEPEINQNSTYLAILPRSSGSLVSSRDPGQLPQDRAVSGGLFPRQLRGYRGDTSGRMTGADLRHSLKHFIYRYIHPAHSILHGAA